LSLTGQNPAQVKQLVSEVLRNNKIIVISCFSDLPAILMRHRKKELTSCVTLQGKSWEISFAIANLSRMIVQFKIT